MFKSFQVFTLALALLVFYAAAQAATVTARLDRTTAVVGETVTLTLQTDNPNQSLDTDLSGLQANFDVLDQRSETQMSIVNGARSASVRMVITLEPKHAGNLEIPALNFKGATSQPLMLHVREAPKPAPGEAEPVFIEVSMAPEQGPYYVLSQIGLVVRVFYQSNLTEASISPPEPTQSSVRLLDEVPYQADRNGTVYRVLERHYAIFPERSGRLTIPAMQLTGRLTNRATGGLWQPRAPGRRVRVESDPIHLEISPKPASYTGATWVPARRLSLAQQVTDIDKLHVGEPLTRTIIIDAVGLEDNMLVEPIWPDIADTRVYPDQPQGISRDDGNWVLGHKEFRYAIVPEKAGELVLPEIKMDWWDTENHRQRTAVLPEVHVNVLPSELGPAAASPALPVAANPPLFPEATGNDFGIPVAGSMLWKAATAVFALLWLGTLFVYMRRPGLAQPVQGSGSDRSVGESALLKNLQSACQNNDASAARNHLSQWIRNYAPAGLRGSMRQFGSGCGDQALQDAIAELDGHGFNRQAAVGWQGDKLWLVFRQWASRPVGNSKDKVNAQPDLYG